MPENNDLPLFEWGKENAKKEEEDRLKRLEEERLENQEELDKLHQYGPGPKDTQKPESEGEFLRKKIAQRKAERKAFSEKIAEDIKKLKEKFGIKNDKE